MTDTEREERARVLRLLVERYPEGLYPGEIAALADLPHGHRAAGILLWLRNRGLAVARFDIEDVDAWWATKAGIAAVELLCEPAQSEGES